MKHSELSLTQGLPQPWRFWAVVAVAIAMAMTVVDQSIVNVALPTIAVDLNIAPSSTVWIVNASQIVILMTLLPMASVGDVIGYRNVYLGGIIVFTVAALAAALSHSLTALTLARILDGFGAAGLMSVNVALVRFIYPVERLGYGIGINAVVIAVSSALGPTCASFILAIATWPWLFAVNVPLGIAAFSLGFVMLPRTPRSVHGFDFISAILSAVTFGCLIAAIDSAGHGASGFLFPAEFITMLVAGFLLCKRQISMPLPLLPIDLLRVPMFTLSIVTSVCSFISQTFGLIALPFFLQSIGFTAVQTGLLITPWPLATGITAVFAGKMADRHSAGVLGFFGLTFFALGLAALAFLPDHPYDADVAWRMALAGMGYGLFQSPNNRTIQANAPRHRAGGASGMQSMARLLGQTIGAALVALVFRLAPHPAFVALLVGAGVAVLGATVSALRLTDITRPA